MTIIKDESPVSVSLREMAPELAGILGVLMFIIAIIIPDYVSGETLGLKVMMGSGSLMITGALLAIERKLPNKKTS